MRQQDIFGFLKKMNSDDVEEQKIKLNTSNAKVISQTKRDFLRKRNKIHLLDGLNYSPSQILIKNDCAVEVNSAAIVSTLSTNKCFIKNEGKENKRKLTYCDSQHFGHSEKISKVDNSRSTFESEPFKDDIQFDDSFIFNFENNLELSNDRFYRFDVKQITERNSCKMLTLFSTKYNDTVELCLDGDWRCAEVNVGDVCNVVDPIKEGTYWRITFDRGLLIVDPDLLISGTELVGSTFCPRKSVLQYFYKNVNGSTNKEMVMGSFLHVVFQKCLEFVEGLSLEKVKDVCKGFMKETVWLQQFYESELSEGYLCKELDIYANNIVKWQKDNITSKTTTENKKKTVLDIEENIWSSCYGLKGKIDVTLCSSDKQKSIIPLELKTGKSSFSNEHIGQVLLYTMLLNESEQKTVDKGLLLYLKDGQQKEILSSNTMTRGLIHLRNEMAKSLKQFMNIEFKNDACLPSVKNSEMFCSKCEYLSLCSLFSRLSCSPLTKCSNSGVQDYVESLSDAELDFFQSWSRLIMLEHFSEKKTESMIKNIVMQTSEKCIRNALFESSRPNGINFLITFKFSPTNYNFSIGDPVIVSSDDGSRLAMLIVFVVGPVTGDSLTVSSDKPLPCPRKTSLRLDLYHSMKIASLNLSVLGSLMSNNSISNHLRRLIISGDKPAMDTKILRSVGLKIKPIVKHCNIDQRRAIVKAILSNGYTLIKGYPGTGKTACIVSMIEVFHSLGSKVLVSSYTHSAIENILMKLKKDIPTVYLNGSRNVPDKISTRSLDYLIKQHNISSQEDFRKLFDSISVFCVTCLSSHHPILSKINFDVVIIDEAGQVTMPATLMPLMKLNPDKGRFILIGDLHQLPPLVTNRIARSEGLELSLFSMLCNYNHTESIVELKTQYRMNEAVLKLCNKITYDECVSCANENVATSTISLSGESVEFSKTLLVWLTKCLSAKMEDSVVFINILQKNGIINDVYSCSLEVDLTNQIIKNFLTVGVKESEIGVISPYNAQVNLLKKVFSKSIEINTIDQFQGKDKSVIIISFVRKRVGKCETDTASHIDILRDKRRLNVAITRAKHKLIMIGCLEHLRDVYKPVRDIANALHASQIVDFFHE